MALMVSTPKFSSSVGTPLRARARGWPGPLGEPELLEEGLVRPSLVPPADIGRLWMLTRYRVQLIGDRTGEITQMKPMLEDASIKPSSATLR
jgi:hypothetical protein